MLSFAPRSRGAVWMGRYRGRWRRSERQGTVGRSGTWWLWIKSWDRTIDTPYTETEGLPPRAQCHRRIGRSLRSPDSDESFVVWKQKCAVFFHLPPSDLSLSGVTVSIRTITPTPWTMPATPTHTPARRPASWLPRWLQDTAPVEEANMMVEEGLWWPIRVGHWDVLTTNKSRCLPHPLRLWTVAPCPFHQWTTGKHATKGGC